MNKRVLFSTSLALGLTITIQSYAAASIKICWEAESAIQVRKPLRRLGPLQRTKLSSHYNQTPSKGYLKMPWVENHLDGCAVYHFRVINPGQYYIWTRIKYLNNFSNRLSVAVNSGPSRVIGDKGTYGLWNWQNGRFGVQCYAGTNTLVLRDMDMAIKVDQILLSSDPDFSPSGIQKPTQ